VPDCALSRSKVIFKDEAPGRRGRLRRIEPETKGKSRSRLATKEGAPARPELSPRREHSVEESLSEKMDKNSFFWKRERSGVRRIAGREV
jgi:hypothetical protein